MEIASSQGKSIIITMDANSLMGKKFVADDPMDQSENGPILSGIIDRFRCLVVSDKATDIRQP